MNSLIVNPNVAPLGFTIHPFTPTHILNGSEDQGQGGVHPHHPQIPGVGGGG